MANVFGYMKECGDVSFDKMPFNHIDGLILSRLSYVPFDDIVSYSFVEKISIKDAIDAFLSGDEPEKKVFIPEDIIFIKGLAKCRRFCNLKLLGYESFVNTYEKKQFAVITIKLTPDVYYVSFRGTDNTFVGFNESFSMCLDDPIPSQVDACNYFSNLGKQLKGDFILGGHSKGGNLAVYAASFCSKDLQSRVRSVYNIDGPGFTQSLVNRQEYKDICSRIYTFVPQSSLIGKLFDRSESEIVIHSTYWWILQHDIYSWEIDGDSFVLMETTTRFSKFVGTVIKDCLEQMDTQQKRQFINFVFGVIKISNFETVEDFCDKKFKNTITLLKAVSDTDKIARHRVYKDLLSFVQTIVKDVGCKIVEIPSKIK